MVRIPLAHAYLGYWNLSFDPQDTLSNLCLGDGAMNSLVKRVLLAAAGMVLMLGWWTIEGKFSGSATAASDKIPAKVWEGGGTTLTIETESSDPVVMRALFQSTARTNGTPMRSLDSFEKIAAGSHTWTVDVPATVGGNLELQAENPKPGSRLSWTVRAGDKVLRRESETLNGALRANEAFFPTLDAEDFSATEPDE